ncbi:MAG: potassium channel family protein [Thermoanaerobaculia bacterium]
MLGDRFWHRYSRGERNVTLLLSLIVLFVLYPISVELGVVRFYRLVFVVELILASISLGTTKGHRRLGVGLGVPAIALQVVAFSAPSRVSLLIAAIATLLFIGFVIVIVYRAVMASGRVTVDKLAAAVNVYLLLGLAWAIVYGVIASFDHTAFAGNAIDFHTLEEYVSFGAEFVFIYFSFVTLTTLGYGDILPMTSAAQTAAWMEAVVGQLFMAVTLARLVGMFGKNEEFRLPRSESDSD